MADDIGFVPSKANDVGFVPGIQAPADIGFVPSKPATYEQIGPATPQKDIGERPAGGDTLETWLWKAFSAPDTFIGRLLNPNAKAGKPITPGGINVSGAEDPFIDPSVSMEPSVAKGIVKAAGSMSSINNMLMAAAPFSSMGTGVSRAMSEVFTANTVPQLWQQYEQYDSLKQQGKDKEAETILGGMLGTFGMGSLALYHAGGFGGKEGKLSVEDEHSLTGILAKELETAARNGDHSTVQDVLETMSESTPEHGKRLLANIAAIADKLEERKNGTDIRPSATEAEKDTTTQQGADTPGPVPAASGTPIQPVETPLIAEENLRDNSGNTGGEGATGTAAITSALNEGNEGATSEGIPDVNSPFYQDWLRARAAYSGSVPLGGAYGGVQFVGMPNEEITKTVPEWDGEKWVDKPGQYPYGSYSVSMYAPNGEQVGALLMGLDGKGEAQVNDTQIHDDNYKGKGYGKEMYLRAAAVAREFGAESIRSGGSTSDEAARVWKAIGAIPIEGEAPNQFRLALQLEPSIEQLKALYPQYAHIIGGGEGTAPAGLEPSRDVTPGALNQPEGAGAPAPPVISRVIDNDLAETGGIHIVEKGKDIFWSRWLGGLAETARKLNMEGHPLGPILTSMAAKMSDVTKAIVTNQMDTMADYVNGAKKYVSRGEWADKVVPLLDNPEITPNNIPADTPNNVKTAYLKAREILDRQRMGIIQAKRNELLNRGVSPEKAQEWVPDDWGKQTGYYHHAFPGTWAISKLAEVDEKGNEIYEPIETGWRAESRNEANDKAIQYLKDNPSAQIRIQQDTVTLPGKNLADRQRLMDLTREIKEAGETVVRGGDPEDVLKQLYADAGAKAFGPRQIASRQLAAALPRESNLAGFATDRDNFEASLLATERYIQLAPARQLLMKARNAIANLAGMPAAQRMGEFPSFTDYFSAKQYGNILARVDSAIEGLEGKPGATDAAVRYTLNQLGWDPNTISNIYKPIQSVMALVKLGFNPARVLSHGLQSLWGVYPVLGEEFTLKGAAHSYDSNYDSLIKDLGITHGVNATEIEGIRSYAGNYFGRGSTPIDWAKGTGSILRDVGLFPFTTGIEFTRRTAAIGAYLQGIDRGYTPEQARNYARDVMDRTTGNYTPSDNAAFLRQLPGPVSQFKNFMLKTMQFTTGLRGPEIARFMAAIGVIGFTGFPALRSMLNLAYNVTGEDVETDIKRKFPISSRGVFGLLGMDVPSGVGLGDLSISREKTPLGGLGGPAVSDAIAIGNAVAQKVIKGPSREAQNNLDTAIRNISPEARRLYDEATRLSTGRPYLIDPRTGAVILSDLSTQERAELLSGITPLRVARERDAHEYIRNQVEQAKDKRGFFVDRLAELQVNLTQPNLSEADRMEILRQTSAYIQQAQDYGLSHQITRAVLQRAKEMQLERLQRDIKLAPKTQRLGAYEEQQRFKGEQ